MKDRHKSGREATLNFHRFRIERDSAGLLDLSRVTHDALETTVDELRGVLTRSGIWDRSVQSKTVSPILRELDLGLPHIRAGLLRLGLSHDDRYRVLTAWRELGVLLRLGRLNLKALHEGFLVQPMRQILRGFAHLRLPDFGRTPFERECLLGAPEIESLRDVVLEVVTNPLDPLVGELLGTVHKTINWVEAAHYEAQHHVHGRVGRHFCREEACFQAWIDDVLSEWSHSDRGFRESLVQIFEVRPLHACLGETVTLALSHAEPSAFPVRFNALLIGEDLAIQREDTTIEQRRDHVTVSFVLPVNTRAGSITVGHDLEIAGGRFLSCIRRGGLRLRAPSIPWGGSHPAFQYVTLHPHNIQGEVEPEVVSTDKLIVHAEWGYSISIRITNAPSHVRVIERSDSSEMEVFDQDLTEQDWDGPLDTADVILTPPEISGTQERERHFMVYARNRCVDTGETVGSFSVTETWDPFVSFAATALWVARDGSTSRCVLSRSRSTRILTGDEIEFEVALRWPAASIGLDRLSLEARGGNGIFSEIRDLLGGNAGDVFSGHTDLPAGTRAIRTRAVYADGQEFTTHELLVGVERDAEILTCMSMGGSWVVELGIDSLGSASSSSSSSSSSGAGGTISVEDLHAQGISATPNSCSLDVRSGAEDELDMFITDLITTAENVQCNNLCDPNCTSFLEHLAVRLMDSGLSHRIDGIHKDTLCTIRESGSGFHNRIVLGKWENSELEPVQPVGKELIKFEDIIREHRDAGNRYVIFVGQSHGGAKLAALTREHWEFGDDIVVPLFVAWDCTDLGGGVTSVGSVPEYVINFYQLSNSAHYQNGAPIQEANRQWNLSDCISHNGIARSRFVHQKTFEAIQSTIWDIRCRLRER